MFFLKKPITLTAFIRMIADEVLKVPPYSYEDYLLIDPDCILSQTEFEEYIRNLYSLRLLLLYAMLTERKDRGQIKISKKDLAKTFIQALVLSYQDNDFDSEEAQRLSEDFSLELDNLFSYVESISEKNLLKKGYTPYACLYVTSKYGAEGSVKNGVYIALINTQRKIMKGHFEKAFDKFKITIK